jgi:CubicO group peptidase (beta-lactamase class C family)
MMKIGACMLNGGTWEGSRVIPGSWIENCALPYAGNHGIKVPGEPSGKVGYSYSWWTKDYSVGGRDVHMYAAGGWGGQHIMVLPELDMVVVFTGANYLTKRPPYPILEKYILPAIG